MSTATLDYGWDWDALYAAWRELDVPDGWSAEITEEGITVTPPPLVPHASTIEMVQSRLQTAVPRDVGVYHELALAFAHLRRLHEPDLVVLPREALQGAQHSVAASQALLVVEVTSKGNARQDRTAKKWAYAHGPVPVYLLVDPWAADGPVTTLFSEPVDGEYQTEVRVPFGGTVALPAPFDVEIDTTEFPRP